VNAYCTKMAYALSVILRFVVFVVFVVDLQHLVDCISIDREAMGNLIPDGIETFDGRKDNWIICSKP
jgi:hypothetical protein